MSYKIAVLIPCFNEEKTIAKVVEDFCVALNGYDYLIYVYDNNSNDDSAKIVNELKSKKVVYAFEAQLGKGNVVRRMFREVEADCYVLVDADDTYPASKVLKMIDYVKNEKIDMVVGDRLTTSYFKENKRRFHSFGNKLVCTLINCFFKVKLKDIMSGYRVFSKKFVKTAGLLASGFELETEMTILALDGKYKIKELPIDYKDRISGSVSKLNTYKDGFEVLKTIFVLFKDYKPFEFFLTFSLMFLILSAILFLPILIEFINTGLVPRFPTLFVSIFFGILAIILFSIGTILSVVTKQFKRNKESLILNYKE